MGQRRNRMRARRGKLGYLDERVELPDLPEGMLDLGLASGGREVFIDLFGIHPHPLIAGATRQGKTKRIRAWALTALLRWGWEVEVIDFKSTGDYWPVVSNGGILHSTAEAGKAALKKAADDVRTRNAKMLDLSIPYVDPEGFWRDGRATTFREIPLEVREREGLRPRLLIIDEGADVASLQGDYRGKNVPRGPGGMSYLREGTQKGASAGVHVMVAIHQPRHDLFEGFIKQNMQCRVLFGKATKETEEMMFGGLIAEHPERSLPRGQGTGFASETTGGQLVRFHSSLLKPYRYDPLLAKPPASPQDAAPGLVGSSDPPGPAAVRPSGSDPLARPSGSSSSDPAVGGVGLGGSLDPPSVGSASSTPSGPARLVLSVRPLATGPFVRSYLRARSLRLLFVRRVAGPFVRDPFKIVDVRDNSGDRCSACGRAGSVDIDHTRPLWAGGLDEPSNMRALCIRASKPSCHRAKTKAERRIRDLRDRNIRNGISSEQAASWWSAAMRVPLYVWVGLTLFVLGLLNLSLLGIPGWALAFIAANWCTWLWPWLRSKMPRWLVKPRAPGLDGRWTYDDKAEREVAPPGLPTVMVDASQSSKRGLTWTRWRILAASSAYLCGTFFVVVLPGLI